MACQSNNGEEHQNENSMETVKDTKKIALMIGSKKFTARLVDSPTAVAFN